MDWFLSEGVGFFWIDGIVLVGLIMLLRKDSALPDMGALIATSLGLTALTFLLATLLVEHGQAGLYGAYLLCSLATALILMFVFEIEALRAIGGGLLFMIVKVVCSGIFANAEMMHQDNFGGDEGDSWDDASRTILETLRHWV